jgi:precorrin-8X/cobalt-precorrin-8 methylmutase
MPRSTTITHARANLFDRYVMVDWSANSTPKTGRDSIWIASGSTRGRVRLVNPPTRREAVELLVDLMLSCADERTLIGFDFSFGYPVGFAEGVAGAGAGWEAVWAMLFERITDADDNANNRFEVAAELNGVLDGVGPFWGHPGASAPVARRRPPAGRLAQFRLAERRVIDEGHRPFSAWQLAYPGSVGSQMMLGIARLEGLRRDPRLAGRGRVWPFETGFGVEGIPGKPGQVLFAEIWPSMFPITSRENIRDAAQVDSMVRLLRAVDRSGELAEWFSPGLSPGERRMVLREEGWTLGVR